MKVTGYLALAATLLTLSGGAAWADTVTDPRIVSPEVQPATATPYDMSTDKRVGDFNVGIEGNLDTRPLGSDMMTLRVTDLYNNLVANATVRVRLQMPENDFRSQWLTCTPTGDGHYMVNAPFTVKGAWLAEVSVDAGGGPQGTAYFDMKAIDSGLPSGM